MLLRIDGPLAVDGLAEGIDNPPQKRLSHRDLDNPPCPLYGVTLFDVAYPAEDRYTDILLLKVENHPENITGEFNELSGHRLFKTVDERDTVSDGENRTHLLDIYLFFKPLNTALYQLAYLTRVNHYTTPSTIFSSTLSSCAFTLLSRMVFPILMTIPPISSLLTLEARIISLPVSE